MLMTTVRRWLVRTLLRDWIAANALVQLTTGPAPQLISRERALIAAKNAYQYADAMLDVREGA